MRRGRVILPDGREQDVTAAGHADMGVVPRWLPPVDGTIVGTLLNYRGELEALGDVLSVPPYQAPSKAPILYLKSANTHIGHGHDVVLPSDVDAVWAGACLGVVIGRTAARVSTARAHDFIAGYTIVNDLTVPHASYYRPAIRHKCRDTCTPIGPWLVDRNGMPDPMNLVLRTTVNGRVTQEGSTRDMIFDIPTLIAWFSSVMTLCAGDMILTGTPEGLADTQPGDEVVTEIEGIGRLVSAIVAEQPSKEPA
ncbi:fumarylacetoacetate hydrolase family protein [Ralstonia sp. UBA689]|uniref:fumarylacetoacetate hydrolase family protein n=1 Tax=Ralstonia sp. UBA689 TaxID=1947373 RepID=UPI0025F77374|nr:fumarylacetoacetate hydrolase family protein [Ralstonia sp. UBA689]